MALTKFTEYLTAGTIALTAGNTVVTLTGYTWVDLQLGDQLEAQGRVGGIFSLDTDTQLTLMLPWTGTTAAGVAYVAWKTSKSRYDPSLTQASLREFTEKLHDSGIVYNVAEGEIPDNAIGEDGQWAIRLGSDGIAMWQKIDGIWVIQVGGAATAIRAFQ